MKKFSLIAVFVFMIFNVGAQNAKEDFYGMWALKIDVPDNSAGWLDVNKDSGFLDAELLWRWGSVEKVSNVYFMDDNDLVVTQTRERVVFRQGDKEFKHEITEIYNIKRNGDKLEGVRIAPDRDGMGVETTKFTGWRLPEMPAAPDLSEIKYGKPITLFNGKDLSGWRLIDPNRTNGFKVVDGTLVNHFTAG